MDGFRADLDALSSTAESIRELAHEFDDNVALKYRTAPAEVGNATLEQALAEFHERSHEAADRLRADLTELASRLLHAGSTYRSCDRSNADLIADRMWWLDSR